MGRARRAVRQPKQKKTDEYDSDDSAAYKDMPVPDKKSSKYVEDEITEFHSKKISKLLSEGVQADSDQEDIADEEEVMPLDVSDSDEEEDEEEEEEEEIDMDSDLEGKKDDDLPNEMAWGLRKKMFYDSDYVTIKGKSQEEVEAEDEEEEQEAKNIQKRLVGNLSEEDYDLHLLQEFAVEEEVEKRPQKEEKIMKDLEKMSKKEKLKLLKKESPELLELIQDFKAKLTELRDEVQPLLEMVKDGRIPEGKGADYLRTKQQLYLNYCTNISFYLVLKARRVPAQNHPVIERLVSFRNLINDLGEVDARLAPQMRQLLSEAQQQEAARRPTGSKHPGAPSRREAAAEESGSAEAAGESDSDLDEEAALRFYRQQEERLKLKRSKAEPEEELEEDEDELDPEAKRGITYQMAKNKGLTPKRKKIDRNPRVKHREKFRRAKIRRKGQVREVRKEEQKYSGELSGIRAGVIKSTKFK
ncbi:hypothetical protein MATL_G00080400 [Megalops atlanticus]|uniref:Sas10 C-terminal domain-containing protein n=1 Tax=Megalops atlanticus TaxID=7932 RepID=A0A9D3Q766_MEGAT|nr:hypothetical protein MATL_G00080400 [Megalops atlanticus]